MRAGPRSEQTALSLAVVEVLNRRLHASPLRSVHGLAKAVPTVSRSQLYLLLRGEAVIDLAELFAVCDALGVSPRAVIAEAEAALDTSLDTPPDTSPDVSLDPAWGPSVAAYDESHPIEAEQGAPEEP